MAMARANAAVAEAMSREHEALAAARNAEHALVSITRHAREEVATRREAQASCKRLRIEAERELADIEAMVQATLGGSGARRGR